MKKCWLLLFLVLTLNLEQGTLNYLFAEVPNEITYTGRLKEYGQAASGTKTMCFKIYPEASGSLPFVWSSGDVSVTVSNGVFSYVLRPNPSVDWRGKDYYIETTISGKTLTPREKLTANAYSFHSRTAEDIEKSSGQNIHFAIGGTTIAAINADGNIKNFVPTGTILPYGGTTAPTGYLLCDGTAVSQTTYADLFAVIQTKFGDGTVGTGGSGGAGKFNVPDLRGRFLRGWDNTAGRDPDAAGRTEMNTGGNAGDNIGSVQNAAFASHKHKLTPVEGENQGPIITAENSGWGSRIAQGGATGTGNFNIENTGGSETRPINANVNYIIKY